MQNGYGVAGLLRALAVSVFLTFYGHGAVAQDIVRIGVGVDPVYTPWWIAEEKGFYKKYNIKAEITQFSGGPDLADATMAGEMDIGASGSATWMPRLVRGSMVVLATMAISTEALKMAAHVKIRSLNDLIGKKVGSVSGSTTDYLWDLVAKKLNVPESSFQIVGMPPPELVPSLDRGDVEAYFVWEPWASRAIEVSGRDKVHLLASNGDVGYLLNFIVVANKKFADSKPDATARVLAALRDAIDFMAQDPATATRVGAEKNKLKPEMATQVINFYKWGLQNPPETEVAVKSEEAWMRGKGRVRGEAIDWGKTIDRRFLDQSETIK